MLIIYTWNRVNTDIPLNGDDLEQSNQEYTAAIHMVDPPGLNAYNITCVAHTEYHLDSIVAATSLMPWNCYRVSVDNGTLTLHIPRITYARNDSHSTLVDKIDYAKTHVLDS